MGLAYARIQGTRPQTLAYGLADSAGQAAWIIEKFWSWMDCNDDPESVLSRDELLDNVMLYWLNNAAGSSARIYWESFNKVGQGPHPAFGHFPLSEGNFPNLGTLGAAPLHRPPAI